jgi:hypothetical protein
VARAAPSGSEALMNGKKLLWYACATWLCLVAALPYWGVVEYWSVDNITNGQRFIYQISWIGIVIEFVAVTGLCISFIVDNWKKEI